MPSRIAFKARLLAVGLVCAGNVGCVGWVDAEPEPSGTGGNSLVTGGKLSKGIVAGTIYDDLVANAADRMADLQTLGARFLRIEILQNVPIDSYRVIVDSAANHNIEVLAVVQSSSIGEQPLAENIEDYASHIEAKIDTLVEQIPNLKYIEIENEPDNYDFHPLTGDNPAKLGLLMVRVYEHVISTRTNGWPQIVGFDFSRPDETAFQAVYDSQPITSHRLYFRPAHQLSDGLPVDIVSIHAYGDKQRLPSEQGYSYVGTMHDGMNRYFAQQFSQPLPNAGTTRVTSTLPVWVTEIGFGSDQIGGLDRQASGLTQAFQVLAAYPQIKAAFAYDYRDDEAVGSEKYGLRGNSSSEYAAHPGYYAFKNIGAN